MRPKVTANNHATFPIQMYVNYSTDLRLLLRLPVGENCRSRHWRSGRKERNRRRKGREGKENTEWARKKNILMKEGKKIFLVLTCENHYINNNIEGRKGATDGE